MKRSGKVTRSSPADLTFMRVAIQLASRGVSRGDGGPFGAVVVHEGHVVGLGWNRVPTLQDPTAHAEIVAIRDACRRLGRFQLTGCTLYTTCEPCPMCLGAIYWARPDRWVYACTRHDAAAIGFDDAAIYRELTRPAARRKIPSRQILRAEAWRVFRAWKQQPDRIQY